MQAKGVKLNLRNVANPVKKRKGRRNKNKRIPYSKIGAQVLSDVNSIRKMFNTELKYNDSVATTTVGTTFTIYLLNALTQGTTSTTRLGDTIRASRLQLNISCNINTASTTGYVDFRIFVIRDLQPNGATFAAASYLQAPTNVLSPINMAQCKRFVTIDDQIFTLDLQGPEAYTYRKVYELNFHPEYGLGNAGTVADISKDALFLAVLSNDNTNMPGYTFYSRFQFIDN